jgi:hypothetical protein
MTDVRPKVFSELNNVAFFVREFVTPLNAATNTLVLSLDPWGEESEFNFTEPLEDSISEAHKNHIINAAMIAEGIELVKKGRKFGFYEPKDPIPASELEASYQSLFELSDASYEFVTSSLISHLRNAVHINQEQLTKDNFYEQFSYMVETFDGDSRNYVSRLLFDTNEEWADLIASMETLFSSLDKNSVPALAQYQWIFWPLHYENEVPCELWAWRSPERFSTGYLGHREANLKVLRETLISQF